MSVKKRIHSILFIAGFIYLTTCFSIAHAIENGKTVKAQVQVVLDKLPIEKQEELKDFEKMVDRYMNDYEWVEEDDVPPIEISVQIYLEKQPTSIEERYTCTILVTGTDIRYYDKRAVFPFQPGDQIEHGGTFHPLSGLIDFYVYLAIANEIDKLGYLEGTKYFDMAKAVMEQGKFTRYNTGWDRRDDLIQQIYSENYKKFREMKDYFFYATSILPEDKKEARKYMAKAIEMLQAVMDKEHDLEAGKKFIDAHHMTVINLFKDTANTKPIKTLQYLDFDRSKLYDEYLY
ncbi:MAG: DUF4835 family protein [Calditrichaeota bacterium]|nr:MAG: DUF4835 family protein [Calditrichota bacterium]